MPEGVLVVRADTDGTIYLSPEPGRPAYVTKGARVSALSPLALVEVMKTFSPIRSPVTGTVERVCVDTGDAVETDQVLFWMREDG
jgi:acetyl-CoA carboxylase biotin carboxyl carrier protein